MTVAHKLGIALLMLVPTSPKAPAPTISSGADVNIACHVLHSRAQQVLAAKASTLLVFRYYQVFMDLKKNEPSVPADCNGFFTDFHSRYKDEIEEIQLKLAQEKIGGGFTHKELEWLKIYRGMDADRQNQQLLMIKLQQGQIKANELKPTERLQFDQFKEQLNEIERGR